MMVILLVYHAGMLNHVEINMFLIKSGYYIVSHPSITLVFKIIEAYAFSIRKNHSVLLLTYLGLCPDTFKT